MRFQILCFPELFHSRTLSVNIFHSLISFIQLGVCLS
uniref:Uncharacterized protein n=1 Tax=Anguilla anguilla TaxID=7936 RepID=A0A0E9VP73_ANGAN